MSGENRISLGKLLAGAQLPALPQSAIRLLELSQNPENGPQEFSVPIESDPGLTSQVLRFVNSSYFGFQQPIASVKLAIAMVGIRTIKNFSLWSAVFSLMPNPRCGPFDLRSLWQDSLRRGIFSRRFAKMLGISEAEDLFAAALLQDMAVPLLAKELPGQYHKLLDSRLGGMNRLSDLERDLFGWTHAEAGAVIARGWRLPDAFANLISGHAEIDDHTGKAAVTGVNVVRLSALLPSTCDEHWPERDRFMAACDHMDMSKAISLDEVLSTVDQEFADFAPVLKLAQPARSLTDYLNTEPVALNSEPVA